MQYALSDDTRVFSWFAAVVPPPDLRPNAAAIKEERKGRFDPPACDPVELFIPELVDVLFQFAGAVWQPGAV